MSAGFAWSLSCRQRAYDDYQQLIKNSLCLRARSSCLSDRRHPVLDVQSINARAHLSASHDIREARIIEQLLHAHALRCQVTINGLRSQWHSPLHANYASEDIVPLNIYTTTRPHRLKMSLYEYNAVFIGSFWHKVTQRRVVCFCFGYAYLNCRACNKTTTLRNTY